MTSAYVSSTASAATSNPPIEVTNALGGANNRTLQGTAIWTYCSTNSATELTTAGFFTDALSLGMKAGDIVLGVYATSVGSTNPIPYMGCIGSVTSTGATLHTLTS